MSTTIVDDDDVRLPTDWAVRCPVSGSQAYMAWEQKTSAPSFMIRRKLHSYPEDDADGILVVTGSLPTESHLDTSSDLIGDEGYKWWYYRLFVQGINPLDPWLTSESMCKSVLIHKIGKHYEVATQRQHLPDSFFTNDAQPVTLTQTDTAEERFNVGEVGSSYNVLDRLIRVFTAELDRVDAHLQALSAMPSIDEAPEAVVFQIANALGYAPDRTSLADARVILTSLAGIYKRVGTSSLIELIGAAELGGVKPRVQEMSAYAMISADLDA